MFFYDNNNNHQAFEKFNIKSYITSKRAKKALS